MITKNEDIKIIIKENEVISLSKAKDSLKDLEQVKAYFGFIRDTQSNDLSIGNNKASARHQPEKRY